ncbi:lipoprotein, partial [Streptomyces rubellomurinus subsp. indigoferus]
RGRVTGSFNGIGGKGENVEFNAIDVQHVGTDRIGGD